MHHVRAGFGIQIEDCHLRAFLREALRRGATDPARCASDQDAASVESAESGHDYSETRDASGSVIGSEHVVPRHTYAVGRPSTASRSRIQAGSIPSSVVLPAVTPGHERLVSASASRVETYGVNVSGNWSAVDLQTGGQRVRFELRHNGEAWAKVELSNPGRHNVANAVAAAA